MLQSLRHKIRPHVIPLGIVTLIWWLIVSSNYELGTIFSGWDNLHSEFNVAVNLQRALVTVWQEYQGLGLLGGMGHGADLTRQLLLAIPSLVFSPMVIRYLWTFSMLWCGAIGAYALVYRLGNREHSFIQRAASLTASVLYLLNLGTIQNFYVTFETFSSFYGFLPWILYGALAYFSSSTRRNALFLFIISFIGSSAFYVQTLFIVLLMSVSVFLVPQIISKRPTLVLRKLRILIHTLLIILSANLFWFIPVVWFTVSSSGTVELAKINVIATPENILMNHAAGDLSHMVQLKGFWFDFLDLFQNQFNTLLHVWEQEGLPSSVIAYSLFAISLVGMIVALVRRSKWWISYVCLFVLSFGMLSSGNGPLGFVYKLFEALPLFTQIFRASFTKWSVVAGLAFSIGIGTTIWAFGLLKEQRIQKIAASLIVTGIALVAILQSLPVFFGEFVSPRLRVTQPAQYQELFSYMSQQPIESRVAFFPMQSFWGWNFYEWGYRGSGFLWYGIEQPILDRAFDVWSQYNETFYNLASTALYREDPFALAQVFEQYDVSYVLLDESVILPEGDPELLRYDYIKFAMEEVGADKVWQQDFLTVYRLPSFTDSFLQAPEQYTHVQSDTVYARADSIGEEVGTYIDDQATGAYYPFSALSKENLTDHISYGENTIEIEKIKPFEAHTVHIPALKEEYSATAQVSLFTNQVVISFNQPYQVFVDGKAADSEIILPKLVGDFAQDLDQAVVDINGSQIELNKGETKLVEAIRLTPKQPLVVKLYDVQDRTAINIASNFFSNEFVQCFIREGQQPFISSKVDGNVYQVEARDAAGCNSMQLGRLNAKSLVTVHLPYRSDSGARPHFCLQKEGDADCINNDVFYYTPTSTSFTDVTRTIVTDETTNYWLTVAGRPPDDIGAQWAIEYQAPTVTTTKLTAEIQFVPEVFDGLWEERRIAIAEGDSIKVVLPQNAVPVDFATGEVDIRQNCDVLNRGYGQKTSRGDVVYYEAEGYGAICDFTNIVASTQREYLMRITGDNSHGRSIKAFLFNQATRRNDLEVLMDEGKFDTTFGVLSWPQPEREYTLTLETRSFGQLSRNRVDSITLYDVPLSWLSQWRIGETKPVVSQLEIVHTTKTGTAFYTADTKGSGLLELSQGYDRGWVAYSSSSGFLDHVQLNGWGNGWLVPDGEQRIYIFFWPQLLQWIGFVVLVITPIVIWKFHLTKGD